MKKIKIVLVYIYFHNLSVCSLAYEDLLWSKKTSEFIPFQNVSILRELQLIYRESSLQAEKARLQGEVIRIGYHEVVFII